MLVISSFREEGKLSTAEVEVSSFSAARTMTQLLIHDICNEPQVCGDISK